MLTIKPLLKHVYFNVNKHTIQIQTLLKTVPDRPGSTVLDIYQIGVIRLHRFQSPSLSICLLSNCFHFVQTVLAVATNENCLLCSVQLLQPACNCLAKQQQQQPCFETQSGSKRHVVSICSQQSAILLLLCSLFNSSTILFKKQICTTPLL